LPPWHWANGISDLKPARPIQLTLTLPEQVADVLLLSALTNLRWLDLHANQSTITPLSAA
jgi:hypothetical protein